MEQKTRKKRKVGRLIFLTLLLIFLIIQFIPVDRTTPDYDQSGDFLVMHDVPEDVTNTLKLACYDCHSYETQYPWYSYIAPVSWWLQDHIDQARDDLNFSLWSNFNAVEMSELYEEIAREVEKENMPLKSYTRVHSDARLTEEQRGRLILYMSAQ